MSASKSSVPMSECEFSTLEMEIALPFFFILILIELLYELLHYRKKLKKQQKLWEEERKKLLQENKVPLPTEPQFNETHSLYRANDSYSSIACGATETITGKILTSSLLVKTYCFAYQYRLFTLSDDLWSVWWLTLLLKDHQYYWFHRFVHECNIGWAAHAVHHSSEEYNLTTALRQSMFQSLFSFPFYIPMALIGISPYMFAIHTSYNLLYQFWIHTRAIDRFPAFIEYFMNTPSHHRVHHGRNKEYIDKNYAGILIVFDKMYGTFEPEREEVVYGLTTPIESFSPAYSQFHLYVDMFKNVCRMPTLKQKLQVIFKGPGFNAENQTIYELPDVPVAPIVKKYHPQASSATKTYALFHLFLNLFMSLLMLADTTTDYATMWTHFIFLFISWASVGYLLDLAGSKSVILEMGRMCCMLLMIALAKVNGKEYNLFIPFVVHKIQLFGLINLSTALAVICITSMLFLFATDIGRSPSHNSEIKQKLQ